MRAEQDLEQPEAKEIKHRLLPSTRLFISLLVGLGMLLVFITRFNINIAVICMVKEDSTVPDDVKNGTTSENYVTSARQRINSSKLAAAEKTHQGEFDWDKQFQALLLSSYYYGYTVFLTPGGMIADRLPANWVVMFTISIHGLLSLLTPTLARLNKYLLLGLRALMGLVCAPLLPACSVILRNWSVPSEYSTLFAITWAFQYFGSGMSYPITSSLCEGLGWPMVFYITGLLPVAWGVLAWFLMASTPDESVICPEKECNYILASRMCRVTTSTSRKNKNEKSDPVPFWAIITNRQVLICTCCFFSVSWFFYTTSIVIPTFLKEVFEVELFENGFLSGLPSMTMAVGVVAAGRSLEYLVTQWHLSKTNGRKIVNTIGMLVPATLLGAMLFLPPGSKDITMALVCVATAVGVSAVSGGPLSAGPEIGPQHTGVIWGVAGSVGNLSGILVPITAAAMTPNKTASEWRYFFVLTVGIMVTVNILVILFWKSEVQQFARKTEEKTQQSNEVKNATLESGNKE